MEEEIQRGGEGCSQWLDLIRNERKRIWDVKVDDEDEKLELRLGLPSRPDWPAAEEEQRAGHSLHSALSIGFTFDASSEAKRAFFDAVEPKKEAFHQQQKQRFAARNSGVAAYGHSRARAPTAPVVGWPPVRSFRKNLTSNAVASHESQKGGLDAATKLVCTQKGFLVKINMDGIPIGRKIDLKAYNSYDGLSLAVDELFRGLLAAQRDPAAAETMEVAEEKHMISGLLDGKGDYSLVYEDDEGDRMLVGDVPWDMFVSTAKRLRVLKSSDLAISPSGAASRIRTVDQC